MFIQDFVLLIAAHGRRTTEICDRHVDEKKLKPKMAIKRFRSLKTCGIKGADESALSKNG